MAHLLVSPGTSENVDNVEKKVDSLMVAEEKKGSSAAPWLAVVALAGIAGVAYLAYKRIGGKTCSSVGDLLDLADQAAQKLEDRIHEFAAIA